MMNLKDRFIQLCSTFTENQALISSLWKEIETKYAEKGRHYHNLLHLNSMFAELEEVRHQIINFPAISFAVFYHDIIYDAVSKSNEEKSALMAEKKLKELGLAPHEITLISEEILATKHHQKSDNRDINYLLDADLSILGKDWTVYSDYIQNIRKEYSIYPDLLYKPGRKKVLNYFLDRESIFKTDYFKEQYEGQAKKNIAAELSLL